jgi:type IV pilus assembly protein PilB
MNAMADPLYKILGDRQLLPVPELTRLQKSAETEALYLDEILIREDVFTRQQLLQILENNYFCPSLNLHDWPFDPKLLALFPYKMALRHLIFPFQLEGETLKVAMADPDNLQIRDLIASSSRRKILPVVALRCDLKRQIEEKYGRLKTELGSADQKKEAPTPFTSPLPVRPALEKAVSTPEPKKFQLDLSNRSATEIVDEMIRAAGHAGVSDIHLQCEEKELAVRMRLDGILQKVASLPKEASNSVISRIKIMCKMDVSEKRLPQDGRYTVTTATSIFDLRVSSLPAQFGEKVVIRLLAKSVDLLDLNNLKMPAGLRKVYQEVIDLPQGFFLVSGPTGSGKTTTLYATLNQVDRERINVITLEDPIEYSLPNVTQVQIHEDIGLTFASGLRSILRQDPDVVLVGEIRDVETVGIACRAALTGHKVFSTIHTNDSAQAITRLTDMGTPPYLVAATLRGVLSQRLVRQICPACATGYPATEAELSVLGYPKIKELRHGAGCPQCNQTGYKGRMAIYEYLRLDETLHRMIIDRASPYTIRHAAKRNGMVLMAEAARHAVLEGLTTVAEIQRVILTEDSQEQVCAKCQRTVSLEFAICPYCQSTLKEKCHRCGNPVESSWEACPSCGEEIEREWKKQHCQHCLAVVDPAWDVCPFCGESPQKSTHQLEFD